MSFYEYIFHFFEFSACIALWQPARPALRSTFSLNIFFCCGAARRREKTKGFLITTWRRCWPRKSWAPNTRRDGSIQAKPAPLGFLKPNIKEILKSHISLVTHILGGGGVWGSPDTDISKFEVEKFQVQNFHVHWPPPPFGRNSTGSPSIDFVFLIRFWKIETQTQKRQNNTKSQICSNNSGNMRRTPFLSQQDEWLKSCFPGLSPTEKQSFQPPVCWSLDLGL